ncbi:Uu.00g084360.m01.CDS01 [Anthostomella pinea]|uniref:Uu.00g084360.m01.CDS01 n=1 Tax=Anthostomella pinea TaxID=933095 RepID=A0AAI8VLQ7_9PEZI|nr:Uu.00g084360.m01.CDS01 [Anthostomella pinea]
MHPSSALVIMLSAAGVLAMPSANRGPRVHLRAASGPEGHLARGFAQAVSLPRALTLGDIVEDAKKCVDKCGKAYTKTLLNKPKEKDAVKWKKAADDELEKCEDKCNEDAEEEQNKYFKENKIEERESEGESGSSSD